MGPKGLLQGLLILGGGMIMDFFEWIQDSYGISPVFAGILLCGVAVFCGMFSILAFVILASLPFHPKEKND
jgi:hypothetical protein